MELCLILWKLYFQHNNSCYWTFSIIFVLLISRSKIKIQKEIPIYLYSAGAIGVFSVVFSNLSFSKLGVSLTLALGLLGQSLSSIFIDHFGLLGMKVIKFEKRSVLVYYLLF